MLDKKHFHLFWVVGIVTLFSLVGCAKDIAKSNIAYPGGETAYPSINQVTVGGEKSIAETAYPPLIEVTAGGEVWIAETQSASFAATMTAVPRPALTALPTDTYSENNPVCYIDPLSRFSLVVAPGWYATPLGGYALILYNYDYNDPGLQHDIFSKGGMKVSLDVVDLPPEKDFDQFVQDRIIVEKEGAEIQVTVTDPIRYTLSAYSGVTFTVSGYYPDVMEILLQSGNRIAIIGLMPANSPALTQAMSILSSLDLFNSESCDQ